MDLAGWLETTSNTNKVHLRGLGLQPAAAVLQRIYSPIYQLVHPLPMLRNLNLGAKQRQPQPAILIDGKAFPRRF